MDKVIDVDKLLLELKSIDENMGIYPAAVESYNQEKSYKERDGFKNGWNACVFSYGSKLNNAIESASEGLSSSEKLFFYDYSGEYDTFMYDQEGGWSVFLNDTWEYACADGEEIQKDQYNEVAKWYRNFGHAGVLYWVYLQRKYLPEITETRVLVETIHDLVAEIPILKVKEKALGYIEYLLTNIIDTNKRDYKDISVSLLEKYNTVYGCCPLSWMELLKLVKEKVI